ncbi:MAG TPA: 2OG-Fe(II) oxygenase [Vicinamibacterales bacterium]|nr:2OG-Fe(II) oxygenase [Vicinamibacterales bacterium]
MHSNLVHDFASRVVWPHERIGYVDLFLSPNEVSFVTSELQYAYWRPSPTYVAMPDGTRRNVVNSFRTSESAYYHWFTPKLLDFLVSVDRQISTAFGFKAECLEPWQATRYRPGGAFEYHRDSGYWNDHPAGERITTFLLHLIAADVGGSTSFRALNLEVPAAPGRLVFWLNLHDNSRADYRMIHSGAPVDEGTKLTLATWQRERPFPRA